MSAWNFPPPSTPRVEIPSGRSLTCLIISDDVHLRNALADAIATEGAGAVALENLDEAVTRLKSTSYPLIFAPQQLPGASGSEICARLRSASGGENAWIVALPRFEIVSLRQIMANGFDGLLRAPFEANEIALLVAGAARNARAAEGLELAHERVDTLRGLAADLSRSTSEADIANLMLEAATTALPNSGGAIWLKDRNEETVRCAGTFGLSADYTQRASHLFAFLTPHRWLELAQQPMFVNAVSDAPRAFTDVARAEGFAASLTIALFTSVRIIGSLVLYTREQTSPSERDIEFLETFAASAALAFDRSEAYQQAEALHSLIEQMPDGVFIHDQDGNFLTVNPAMEQLSGHSRGDLGLLNIFDLLEGGRTGNAGLALARQMQIARESDQSSDHTGPLLIDLIRPDKRVVQAELYLRPLHSGQDHDPHLLQGVLHDVTERERTRREFDALRAIATATASTSELEVALNAVVATLIDQAGYEDATVWMLHQNGVELVARTGQAAGTHIIPVSEGPAGRAAATREAVLQRSAHGQLSVVGQSSRSQVCVPILASNGVLGVIDVSRGPRTPLDDGDVVFLSSLASHLASSVARIQLHDELQRQATIDSITGLENRETFLRRLADAIETSQDESVSLLILGVDRFKDVNDTYGHIIADDILRQVAETLKGHVRAPQAIARFTSDQFAVLLPATGRSDAPAIAENLRIAVATQLFMAADQVEQMTVSVGAASFPIDADSVDQLLLAASHAMYLAKQAGRNQVYQSNEAFAELAVAHGRITDLLRQSPKETLALLVRAMDQRTPERAGHSQRVADYAITLGKALGMLDDQISALRISAVIHDIGMFSLPDSLLRKPAGLSDSERELLYSIPVNAYRLLSQIGLPASVLPSVVHQHEHWDGSGFPSRLQGEQIPPGARIIAVADAIDAMTSDRAHRQSLSMDAALATLSEQAGQHFDPDVVQAAHLMLGKLQDVSQNRTGGDLESTLAETLATIPSVERETA